MSNLEELKQQLDLYQRLLIEVNIDTDEETQVKMCERIEVENAIWVLEQRIKEAEYQALDPEVRFKLEHRIYGSSTTKEPSDK